MPYLFLQPFYSVLQCSLFSLKFENVYLQFCLYRDLSLNTKTMTLFRIINNCLLGGLDTTLCCCFFSFFFNWLLGHVRECFELSPGSALGMTPGGLRGPYMMPGWNLG